MRVLILTTTLLSASFALVIAQQKPNLVPTPKTVALAQLNSIDKLDGQLIELAGVKVVHADTAQVFEFSGDSDRKFYVLIPAPAIDAARAGDAVEVVGTVRHYAPKDFERDYRWYKETDYPNVRGGDWVIVATSVRTPEGTELVPGNTISTMPLDAPKTKPPQR